MNRKWARRLDLALAYALPIVAVLTYAIVQALTNNGVHLVRGSTSAQARDLLWFALICGLASYATIEGLKRIVRVRGHYQLWQVKRWLERDADGSFRQLLRALGLGRGDHTLRVFNLPTEQLVAQISAAADVALADPVGHGALIYALAAPVPDQLLAGAGPDEESRTLRSQLAQRMRLGIDRLQISLAEQWRRTVQGAALWIAGLYGIFVANAADVSSASEPRYVLAALLLGGPIAWVLRDLAAAVERARR